MDFEIDLLAVLLATVAHQALGFLWYAVLFSGTWLKAMGKTREDISQGDGPDATMAFGALLSLASALGIALLLTLVDDPTVADGIAVGAVCGVAFAATSTFMISIYEQKKMILATLYSGYQILGFVIMGAIIGAMQ
jgi:hypothetical protein